MRGDVHVQVGSVRLWQRSTPTPSSLSLQQNQPVIIHKVVSQHVASRTLNTVDEGRNAIEVLQALPHVDEGGA